MKIIHTADIHLDSKMESYLDLKKANKMRDLLLSNFGLLVDYAKNNSIDAIIIAGDLFDNKKVNQKSINYCFDLFKNNPQITFFYLCGNHDINPFINLPENVKTFNREITYYHLGDIVICGSENNQEYGYELDEKNKNIVIMHGLVSNYDGYDVININKLKNKKIDLLALGHIHTNSIQKLDERGFYAYSGCLTPRGFDELNDKGFGIITVSDKIEYEFIPFIKALFYEIIVDITGLETYLGILNNIKKEIKEEHHNKLVKIILRGSVSPYCEKHIEHLLDDLSNQFYFLKIYDETSIKIDVNDYINDISLKGEVVREVMNSNLENKEKEDIISICLKALMGENKL